MKSLYKHIFPIIVIFITGYSMSINAQPSNTFDASSDGWTAATEGGYAAPTLLWKSATGNPGGCYQGTDNNNGVWYYYSPAAFNTDLSSYYGCALKFDLKQNTALNQTNDIDVMIVKTDDTRIVYSTPTNPGTVWTSYAVVLSETGWKYTSLAGASVSLADMVSYLTNVKYIKIRGDYSSLTTESDWLDNVSISCDALILPVELSQFTGTQSENHVAQLSWTTLSENNCNYFQIEKSMNNGLSFDSIGFINANGTSTQENNYIFYDDNLFASSYYRLKQVDNDYTASYSNIINVKATGTVSSTTSIYPNPSNSYFTIKIAAGNYSYYQITNSLGVAVINKTRIDNGSEAIKVDTKNLPSGIYYVSLSNDFQTTNYSVQIIH